MRSKAQSSLEYVIMLAISLGVFTAILYVINTMISGSTSQIGVDSAYRAVEEIKQGVDFTYVHGDPSKTQVTIYIPPNINSISISGKEINLRLDVNPSYTDVYAIARANITGDLSSIVHEGYYLLEIESDGFGKSKIIVK